MTQTVSPPRGFARSPDGIRIRVPTLRETLLLFAQCIVAGQSASWVGQFQGLFTCVPTDC